MTDSLPLFNDTALVIFFKIALLIGIGLFIVFTVFLLNYIRSLKRIVVIKDVTGAALISIVAVGYVIVVISLFILALAIL